MGHYCWVCQRVLPNEKFSGKGHRTHICKKCKSLPIEERNYIQNIRDIHRFFKQRNISKKNMSHLRDLSESSNEEVAELAGIILEVALVKPHRRNRIKFLRRNNEELLKKLEEKELVEPRIDFEFLDFDDCDEYDCYDWDE